MAPAVQADALVEGCRVVERDPVGDAGSVDILHELEMGQGFTDQNSGFVDVVQLPGGGDQVGIVLGAVTAQESLRGQFHSGEGVHHATPEDLVPGDRESSRVHLAVRVGGGHQNGGTVWEPFVVPVEHHVGSQHLVVAGDVDILQGQGVFPTVDPEVHVFQGRDAFRQLGLQFEGDSLAHKAAMRLGP